MSTENQSFTRSIHPAWKRAAQTLYDEAGLKLQHANEILSHGLLMPGNFNSVEVRRAMQEASEAVAVLAELDLLLKT